MISRLNNPVKVCGWCTHPMDVHDFAEPAFDAVPCAHCPDNICDMERLGKTLDERARLQLP